MSRKYKRLSLLMLVFASLLAHAGPPPMQPPFHSHPPAPAPAPVPSQPPAPSRPPVPPSPPSYQFGHYPWSVPFDGSFNGDTLRVAWIAYQFYQDMSEYFSRMHLNEQLRDFQDSAALLSQGAYYLNEDIQNNYYNRDNVMNSYFDVVQIFINMGHMLGDLQYMRLPSEMYQEWNDLDYSLYLLDGHFSSGYLSKITLGYWAPGYWGPAGWVSPFWGRDWWGYRQWRRGEFGHPGWGWHRNWRWGNHGWWGRHPGGGGGHGHPGWGGGPGHPGWGGGHGGPGWGGGHGHPGWGRP